MNEVFKPAFTEADEKMKKSIESLGSELKKIRTGRAHVSMLDAVKVDYYGNLSPISQVASVSCPDAKSFMIAPWEASMLKPIEASIIKSNLGMSPMSDGKIIRLKLPDLTEERRKDLVKQTKKLAEDARVSIRMARRDANEFLKSALKDKTISEDDQKKLLEDTQKITDGYIKKVDLVAEEKEKDIMTI